MEPQKKLLMIVNPRAGRSKPRGPLYDAAAALCDAGYLLRIRRTTAAGDAARIAAQEGGDYDTVVAVGGDGTLNEVISGIQTLKTPPAVGYLPQGSTNDFAAASDKEISNKSPIFIIIPICATVIGIASDIGIGISPATADAPVAE